MTVSSATGPRFSQILGLGGYRPERVVPNSELVEAMDSSDQWIQERSGIKTRHRAADDESVIDMAVAASREALAYAGLEASVIDTIILATVSHPFQTPAAAPEVAARLGLTCAAFDISAACAGYCYGVALASDLVRGGTAKHVLVIGVEKLSDFTDPADRSTGFLFGDGAGAAVIGPSETQGIYPTVWGSDGTHRDAITQRESWIEVRDRDLAWPTITMQGQTVFRWAVWSMAKKAQEALDAAGVRADELAAFIPHQANMRIIDAMIKTLHLPPEIPVARDIETTANTSAASVPLAMERMLREGTIERGGLALQIGFGAGLVYAAQVVRIP